MIVVHTYWDSPEAKKLFLGNVGDNRNVLQQRIERLQLVHQTIDGWRDLVDKHDKNNLCSAYDIFKIRQRTSTFCLAYDGTGGDEFGKMGQRLLHTSNF
jgi:hypothetical protein